MYEKGEKERAMVRDNVLKKDQKGNITFPEK